ncbi:MAG: hypothetical protein ABIS18_10960 [Actinomycetota bacterium]
MSVRIGWSLSRPRERKPGRPAGGVWLFQFLKISDRSGRHFVIGLLTYNRKDLQLLVEEEQVLDLRVIGILRFTKDVTPALVGQALGKITVAGKIIGPAAVKDAIERGNERSFHR